MTRDEISVLRRAIRTLDIGASYCRYCCAGSHNQWQHAQHCSYVESVKDFSEAVKILTREVKLCSEK